MTGRIAPRALAGFLIEEIARLIETRRRRAGPGLVLVETGAGAYRLHERRGGAVRLLAEGSLAEIAAAASGPLGRRAVELRLDPARVIDKILSIPAASRLYADAVVRHQLDRMTPFAPGAAVFAVEERGLRGEGAGAELDLRVVVMARTALATALAALAAAGIRPARIGLASDAVGAPGGIDLAAGSAGPDRARLRGRLRTALSAVLLSCGVAAAGSHLLADLAAREGEGLARSIAELRGAATERLRGAEGPQNPVLAEKLAPESLPAAVVLNEMSRLLPEGTYLTALAIEDGKVRLTGLSDRASALVGLIEASDLFSGVAFAAPVLSGQEGGLERFEILAPIGGPVS